MIRLHIIAEGQTEETFVRDILTEHLLSFNVLTDVHCITTNQKLKKRGGLVSYEKAKKDIMLWLKQEKGKDSRFTTMFDLYALPNEFPNYHEAQKITDIYQKIEILETAFKEDINDYRFIPYLQLHEFEALILTAPNKLIESFPNAESEIKELTKICQSFGSPELINEGENTAPSKRIINFIPSYEGAKVSVAPVIVGKIGLDNIRVKCPHFNQWLTQLENLSEEIG
jgi:hypothetical protein